MPRVEVELMRDMHHPHVKALCIGGRRVTDGKATGDWVYEHISWVDLDRLRRDLDRLAGEVCDE